VRPFDESDERPHAPGPSSAWTESWEWRLVLDDGSLAVTIAVVRRPAESRLSYLGAVMGRDRPTVSVIEHEIPLPKGDALEMRASGIWADHVCETPFVHWSVGIEAFGLTFDEPDDAVGHARGVRTPVGFDLEWEDADSMQPVGASGYLTVGRAHGEVLVGSEEHDVEGAGHRMHRWGTGPRVPSWWGRGADVGVADHAASVGRAAPDVAVARAVADDDVGTVIEWTLSCGEVAAPEVPSLASRIRPGGAPRR
jgi:hypothetical protein